MNLILYQICIFLTGLALLGVIAVRAAEARRLRRAQEHHHGEIERLLEVAKLHSQLSALWREEFEWLASTVAGSLDRPEAEVKAAAKIALRDSKTRLESRAEKLRSSSFGELS